VCKRRKKRIKIKYPSRSIFWKDSSVILERAYPTIEIASGSRPRWNRAKRLGYVFFFARSPEAPSTTMLIT
jgi:hypothetical protein